MKIMFSFFLIASVAYSGEITIDAAKDHKPISPYIYGRNNSISDNPSNPTSASRWKLYNDAGVRFFRESGGNNSTKYNWRKKLSSHPDWYNNVYAHDWNTQLRSLAGNTSDAVGMWTLQLIGWAASNTQNNFDDWSYNQSQWWEGVTNNWAGNGNPNLYLESWPADSTVGILSSWLGSGIDPALFQYWEMDNEPEIWNGTHDDVMPQLISADAFMQRYFDAAKKARAIFPEIKIMGPVPANEWQWYNWNNDKIFYKGKSYTWLEYFILRVAEGQTASGVRLLDVLSLHFYPGENTPTNIVQLHRIWFDKNYVYPGANGVKRTGAGSWDASINKEYVFQRCRDWLDTYLGTNNGVTLAVTEMDVQSNDPDVIANWYASTLGVFANKGVEVFTPWSWKTGQWEVLHLYSRYFQSTSVSAVSDNEATLSAYASVNENGNSMTVVLVNRNLNSNETANVNLQNYQVADGSFGTLQLSNLPGNETFLSHESNALAQGTVTVASNTFSLTLPPLSVTAVLLSGDIISSVEEQVPKAMELAVSVYPNPFNSQATISYTLPTAGRVLITIFDELGREVEKISPGVMPAGSHQFTFDGKNRSSGVYFVQVVAGSQQIRKKVIQLK